MDDRRGRGFRFDWTLNIGNIVSAILLLLTFMNYGSKVITYLSNVDSKVNIMWMQFAKEHPDAAYQYDYKGGK